MFNFKLVKINKVLYFYKKQRNLDAYKIPKSVQNNIYSQGEIFFRYTQITKNLLGSTNSLMNIKPLLSSMNQLTKVPILNIPNFDTIMTENIRKVNSIINDSIRNHLELINTISFKLDIEKINKLVGNFKKKLRVFLEHVHSQNLCVKLEYLTEYYEIYLENEVIREQDIYKTFKKHYQEIKSNLLSDEFYLPKQFYISRAIDNFENKRYVEASMLFLASIEYLVIYQTFNEEREPKYKRINAILSQDIQENADELFHVINSNAIDILKCYYSSHNDIEDPNYINRNRLMHGIMEAQNIKKLDCIKLIYLLDLLPVIEVVIEESDITIQ
ncbi:TPA: hypothetical protein ACU2V2_002692 [Staphylococcus aureus]